MAANALGGVKVCPQNKDISDNWPEWYEGLNNDFLAYASACNGEVLGGERDPIALFPQPDQKDRFHGPRRVCPAKDRRKFNRDRAPRSLRECV